VKFEGFSSAKQNHARTIASIQLMRRNSRMANCHHIQIVSLQIFLHFMAINWALI